MADDNPADEVAINAKYAAFFDRMLATSIRPATQHLIGEAFATSRWLLASLLAVNGGALAAALGSDAFQADQLDRSVLAWLVGIVAALLTGLGAYVACVRTTVQLLAIAGLLENAMRRGRIDLPRWRAATSSVSPIITWYVSVPAAIAALAFVFGAILAVPALEKKEPPRAETVSPAK